MKFESASPHLPCEGVRPFGRASFMGVQPAQPSRALCLEGPVLSLIYCSHHPEIPAHFEQGTLHFYLAQDPASFAVALALQGLGPSVSNRTVLFPSRI